MRHARLLIATVPLMVLLGLAAAGVATAGGGCHGTDATPTEAGSTVVKIDGCTFAPTITRVPVGTEVRFLNSSNTAHDVTGRSFEWGSDSLALGGTYVHRFSTAGLYPYSCSLHPGMAGVVVVGSPDLSLASDVQVAPVSAPAPAATSDATIPILAAGGLGLLGGAIVAGGVVSRRQRVD